MSDPGRLEYLLSEISQEVQILRKQLGNALERLEDERGCEEPGVQERESLRITGRAKAAFLEQRSRPLLTKAPTDSALLKPLSAPPTVGNLTFAEWSR